MVGVVLRIQRRGLLCRDARRELPEAQHGVLSCQHGPVLADHVQHTVCTTGLPQQRIYQSHRGGSGSRGGGPVRASGGEVGGGSACRRNNAFVRVCLSVGRAYEVLQPIPRSRSERAPHCTWPASKVRAKFQVFSLNNEEARAWLGLMCKQDHGPSREDEKYGLLCAEILG
jgi:hypothetical protein